MNVQIAYWQSADGAQGVVRQILHVGVQVLHRSTVNGVVKVQDSKM